MSKVGGKAKAEGEVVATEKPFQLSVTTVGVTNAPLVRYLVRSTTSQKMRRLMMVLLMFMMTNIRHNRNFTGCHAIPADSYLMPDVL